MGLLPDRAARKAWAAAQACACLLPLLLVGGAHRGILYDTPCLLPPAPLPQGLASLPAGPTR